MTTILKKKKSFSEKDNLILLTNKKQNFSELNFSDKEIKHIKKELKNEKEIITINQYDRFVSLIFPKTQKNKNQRNETIRLIGDKLHTTFGAEKSVVISATNKKSKDILLIAEGLSLSNYTFTQHKSDPKPNNLKEIFLINVSDGEISELQNIIDSVYFTRDLINQPFSHLTAIDLANQAKISGKENGIKVTVFNKKKIEGIKMGGLLAVNKGSLDEPTFTIMEWSPKNAKNKQPIVLVGKGVVYDTGGLSLKPTANSMDLMKIDMGGAGTVIGAINAIASNKLPVHIVALVPATDNRPSGNAYAPGDVITMYDGTKVEVLNTDAEGRMILADALSYAKKYNPELVIDFATLTGAAVAAIGHYGLVSMHKDSEKDHAELKKSGQEMHERLAEFPFWSDYDDLIKSDIADIKNLGGPYGGAITAGKFLSHFTDYPWIHIDMPGVYSKVKYGYRGKGATGMGVRLVYNFVKKRYSNGKI
ncbi:MAG: peptidase M17 [Flavobacteriales bacterium]|nr:peptidase M17 [Flavobacteriales bacterium]|tara:strand:- start:81 stop:1511 length:1431 start_codon:yes stop_codon:yes gene_type:complete